MHMHIQIVVYIHAYALTQVDVDRWILRTVCLTTHLCSYIAHSYECDCPHSQMVWLLAAHTYRRVT